MNVAPGYRQLCLEIAATCAHDPHALRLQLDKLLVTSAWHWGKQGKPLAAVEEFCAVMSALVIDEVLALQANGKAVQ